MLTPRFGITQTDEDVTIVIHAPYANIKDAEMHADGVDFLFYSTPYFLKLQLPGKIKDNDSFSGTYNCEKGDFTLSFSKVNKGEHFKNLEMITSLLAPKKKRTVIPNIEVIGNPSVALADMSENDVDNSGNNSFPPQDNSVGGATNLINSPKYGFANKISGALAAFGDVWIKEIIDLPAPDVTPEVERKSLREQRELKDFSEEHYMADLMESDVIKPCLIYQAEWDTLQTDQIAFSKAEIDLLKELPNKEYLLNVNELEKLCFNLVDILYASCYNHRTTFGENNSESGWTINKLSSTLCWFQNFTSPNEVTTACIRRALCYPLHRNWELSIKVLEDVKKVLSLGRKYVIKRFCEIHSLFNDSFEPRYILNQLYIKDFLIWLQTLTDPVIESIHAVLLNIHPNKDSMGLELVELEIAAYSVQEDFVIENAIHKMTNNIEALSMNVDKQKMPKNVYHVNQKFFKCLLSSSSSSTDSSDTDSDSNTSSSSSSSSSFDSDDIDGEPK
ncbi:PREDICTED: protein SHQ1 homolog isoform X1 [Trachymyrmex cornetzi]|uniref:protein SHQ1 homolog isoform X1 n=1 Tax=Trachymyrmex cornetzi TaxID=471704 RepID=UPI00084F6C38|nr:PREDICTED: protein SHQ1 homolog isoform X1 [Trachymyrmex cornetzi]XP_018364230.1 PREDICTED: protein SHQ1 homolog isoform X1 [Trachymyrmex cornetzi]